MIRSSAQPSTKACASSALANETCAICACLRCRTFTCGAATTTTLMRRRGDSRPRQRGGQAYLHTAVAPDDSLDAPFGRTRREGDLDPAGPHGSCQKARDLVRCYAPRHARLVRHTPRTRPSCQFVSLLCTKIFWAIWKKNSFHTSLDAPLLVIKSDAGRSIACDPLRAAAHVDLQREDGRHRPSHLAAHHHLCVADHCHLLGHDACDRNDAEHRCARRAPLCVVQPWRVPVRHVAPLPKRRNASSAFGALCADTVASPWLNLRVRDSRCHIRRNCWHRVHGAAVRDDATGLRAIHGELFARRAHQVCRGLPPRVPLVRRHPSRCVGPQGMGLLEPGDAPVELRARGRLCRGEPRPGCVLYAGGQTEEKDVKRRMKRERPASELRDCSWRLRLPSTGVPGRDRRAGLCRMSRPAAGVCKCVM